MPRQGIIEGSDAAPPTKEPMTDPRALDEPLSDAELDELEVFLASDASSGITGEVIYVDCGYSIMGF